MKFHATLKSGNVDSIYVQGTAILSFKGNFTHIPPPQCHSRLSHHHKNVFFDFIRNIDIIRRVEDIDLFSKNMLTTLPPAVPPALAAHLGQCKVSLWACKAGGSPAPGFPTFTATSLTNYSPAEQKQLLGEVLHMKIAL